MAPARQRFGLLGGGVSTLPSGYLQAEFLESTGTQYIITDVLATKSLQFKVKYFVNANVYSWSECFHIVFDYYRNIYTQAGDVATGYNGIATNHPRGKAKANIKYDGTPCVAQFDYAGDGNMAIKNSSNEEIVNISADPRLDTSIKIALFGGNSKNDLNKYAGTRSRIFWMDFLKNGQKDSFFIPAIDSSGVPCMFDKVNRKPFYNNGSGSFIVGMTMEQARKMSKLPAGGGTLTVSLPSNYAEDEGVVNALATAQENGWIITLQTYEAEAAASTFALRRVWVRKRAEENGSYVDADGTRWQVEWCVDIVGADPEQEGYEPFRSVESAVEYWGLQPWVDPEMKITNDDLLITNDENE